MSWKTDLYLEKQARERDRARAKTRWQRFLIRWRDRLLG